MEMINCSGLRELPPLSAILPADIHCSFEVQNKDLKDLFILSK